MAVISRHTRRRLQKGCQVAIPGLGLIGNSDLSQDSNQRGFYNGDIDSAPEERSRGIAMSFTGNSESSSESCSNVERDFLENMYSFYEAEVARALDHNSTRSNKSAEQQSHNTTRSNRAIIMMAISNAMEEASEEVCSMAQGKIDQGKFLEILRARVAKLKLNDKLASNMYQQLNDAVARTFKRRALAAQRIQAKKEDTRKLLMDAARA